MEDITPVAPNDPLRRCVGTFTPARAAQALRSRTDQEQSPEILVDLAPLRGFGYVASRIAPRVRRAAS